MHFCNLFAWIFLFSFVYFCKSEEECLNIDEDGICLTACPEGTFAYNPGCNNITISQKTCHQPQARSLGYFCDYLCCDCLHNKYWDEAAMKCVLLEECSDQTYVMDENS